ncbi:MAG: hypothetical protein MUO59_03795 [Actinobacteria bacterium]|nr:hypothetical protein [Actinomycetota bacterium]
MAEELTKRPDEIYCPECGRTIQRDSRQCKFCDTDFRKLFEVKGQQDPGHMEYSSGTYYGPQSGYSAEHIYNGPLPRTYPAKSKTVAVVLAIFFGPWSWLYTFKNNALKFWITLGVSVVISIMIFFYSCSLITDSVNYGGYGADYFSGSFIGFIIFTNIISFGAWVWSIVDNAIKTESFYRDYPAGK